jgi:hypothetical protein
MVDTVIVEAESSPVSAVMASALGVVAAGLAATEGGAARDGRSILLALFWR